MNKKTVFAGIFVIISLAVAIYLFTNAIKQEYQNHTTQTLQLDDHLITLRVDVTNNGWNYSLDGDADVFLDYVIPLNSQNYVFLFRVGSTNNLHLVLANVFTSTILQDGALAAISNLSSSHTTDKIISDWNDYFRTYTDDNLTTSDINFILAVIRHYDLYNR